MLHDTSSRVSRILQVQTKLNDCPKFCCCTLQAFSKRFFFLNWKKKKIALSCDQKSRSNLIKSKGLPFLDFQKLHKLLCNWPTYRVSHIKFDDKYNKNKKFPTTLWISNLDLPDSRCDLGSREIFSVKWNTLYLWQSLNENSLLHWTKSTYTLHSNCVHTYINEKYNNKVSTMRDG